MADPVNYCSWVVPWFCITQSEWAAWTQAIMSVAAIVAAARIASAAERRLIWRRAATVKKLLQLAADLALVGEARYMLHHGSPDNEGLRSSELYDDRRNLVEVAEALAALPLHDLQDADLVTIVHHARRTLTQVSEILDDNVPEKAGSLGLIEALSEHRAKLQALSDRAFVIQFLHSGGFVAQFMLPTALKWRRFRRGHAAS